MPAVKTSLKDQWVRRFIQLSGESPNGESNDNGSSAAMSSSAKPAKAQEDPLRADRKIAALLDQRAAVEKKMQEVIAGDSRLAEARKQVDRIAAEKGKLDPEAQDYKQQLSALKAKCDEIVDAAVAGNQELETLGNQHESISAKIEEEVRRLNKEGVSPQPRKPEYEGEEKKVGWRADIWDAKKDKDPVIKELFRESTMLRTEYYNAKQRDESELNVGLDGRMYTKDGMVRSDARIGDEYVINPESGKMHEFRQTKQDVGEKTVDPRSGKEVAAAATRHHSSVLAGKEVTGAGGFETDIVGNLTKVTNVSGHYKPGIAKLMQSVEKLLEQGALLDKSWKGAKNLKGKEKQLFTETEKIIGAASKLQVHVRRESLAMTRTLDQNPEADVSAQATAIASMSVQLKKQLDALTKAQQVLAKLGVTQKNKMTGEVEFVQVKDDMTGLQVKTAETKSMKVDEFLKTGGGYTKRGDTKSAAEHKQAALKELEAKTASQRQKLDDEAEKTATTGSTELPHDIDDVLEELAASLGETRRADDSSRRVASPGGSSTTDHYSEAKIGEGVASTADDHYSPVELSSENSAVQAESESDSDESESESDNSDGESDDSEREPTIVAYKSTDPINAASDRSSKRDQRNSSSFPDESSLNNDSDSEDEDDSEVEENAPTTFAYKTTDMKEFS
jgi:hypothetical protein